MAIVGDGHNEQWVKIELKHGVLKVVFLRRWMKGGRRNE
jgi:hypothetical protein